MKKLTVLAMGLLLLIPTLAFSDQFSFRIGNFWPGASTNVLTHPNSLWAIEFDQMSFKMSDYDGVIFGVGYDYFLSKNVSLCFTLDYYHQNEVGYYTSWVLNSLEEGDFAFPYDLYLGDDIVHSFNVSSTPLQLSLKFFPLGRRTKLIPFVGGGGSLVFWGINMFGDQVNFGDPWIYTDPELGDIDIYPVEPLNGNEHGTALGWHAFGGFQFPIGFRTTIEVEARYHWAKAHLNDWFVGFEDFDLSGLGLTFGVNFWF